jgi:hypothetical protein
MEQMEQYSREHKNGQNSGADQEDVQKPQRESASVIMETETRTWRRDADVWPIVSPIGLDDGPLETSTQIYPSIYILWGTCLGGFPIHSDSLYIIFRDLLIPCDT